MLIINLRLRSNSLRDRAFAFFGYVGRVGRVGKVGGTKGASISSRTRNCKGSAKRDFILII
jgi:hypothetical protein